MHVIVMHFDTTLQDTEYTWASIVSLLIPLHSYTTQFRNRLHFQRMCIVKTHLQAPEADYKANMHIICYLNRLICLEQFHSIYISVDTGRHCY